MSRRSYRVVFNCTVVFNLILATRERIFYSVLFTLWFVYIFFNPLWIGTHATLDFVLTFKFIFSVLLFHGSFHIKRILGQIRKDSHGLLHNRFFWFLFKSRVSWPYCTLDRLAQLFCLTSVPLATRSDWLDELSPVSLDGRLGSIYFR